MSIKKVFPGARFGRLVVVEFVGNKSRPSWMCLCSCGREKIATASDLNKGSTKSCGCLANEQRKAAAQGRDHAYTRAKWPAEYRSWNAMIRRCYDAKHPSFARYSKNGITVCDEWRTSFPAFCSDMGKCPSAFTLDRIDNAFGYTPSNCRWASRKTQANNRRNNVLITCNGETLNVSQWGERLGVSKSTIASRISYGWDSERAVTTPARVMHYQEP